MRIRSWLFTALLFFFTSYTYAAEKAIVLDIEGAIGPATVDYFKRGLAFAQKENTPLLIVQLNTPGGLDTSMRSIIQAIISSPIPIVTYVAPAGARAASAGTFIVYASHIAAMAPGTNIGASTPVTLIDDPTHETPKKKEMNAHEKKAINDAVAYLQSLAELRKRNLQWPEKAVRDAASISATEAKKINVINEIAKDYPELLKKIDGYKVAINGETKTLNTKNMVLEKIDPDWRHQFLSFITNPNIAYLLMLLAIYGLFFELSNPGLVLPGVAGVIALLLVLYAFQLMPINYVGLSLLLIGITFMLLEFYVTSYGVVGLGGVVSFIIGSIMLFDSGHPDFQIMLSLIITMSIISITFFFMLLSLAVKSHKRAIVTGKEGLIGCEGIVLSVMNEQVVVRIMGEIWEARSETLLSTGQTIKVIGIHGLTLLVVPTNNK